MLGKLIKHEFRATSTIFLLGWLIILAIAGAISLSQYLFTLIPHYQQNTVLTGFMVLSGFLLVFLFISLIPACLILYAFRFYKNLMKDEGYLMFTLPVNAWHHVFSKLLVSIVWSIGTIAVVILSVFVLFLGTTSFTDIADFFTSFWRAFGNMITDGLSEHTFEIILYFSSIFASGVCAILQIYAAISIGQSFGKHKLAASILSWLCLSAITGIIGMIVQTIVFAANGQLNSYAYAVVGDEITTITMLSSLVLNVVLIVGYFFVCTYMLKRHLNLE